MKKSLAIAGAAAAILLTGCIVTSVYPFYSSKDVMFEPGLVGSWTNVEHAGETWKFEAQGTNVYELTVTSSSETNVMAACRFKLDHQLFLDLFTSKEVNDAQPPPIPSHFLLRVSETNDALRLVALDYDWLYQVLTNQPSMLRHCFVGAEGTDPGRLVLTADTAELQKFVLKHLQTSDAWKDPFQLKRCPADAK